MMSSLLNDRILGNIVNDHKESRARARTNGRSEDLGKEDLVDVLLRLQEDCEFPSTDNNVKAIICVSQIYFSSLH